MKSSLLSLASLLALLAACGSQDGASPSEAGAGSGQEVVDEAALHTALRAPPEEVPALATGARAEIDRALKFAESVRDGRHLLHTFLEISRRILLPDVW